MAQAASATVVYTRRRPVLLFPWVMRLLAAAVPLLIIAIGVLLYQASQPSRHAFGWAFLRTSVWDPVFNHFGAWPFIFGTLFTTAIALVLAAPLGVAAAIFMTEVAPHNKWVSATASQTAEMLAAVPSVVYGLWGIFILAPVLQNHVEPWLGKYGKSLPLFQGPPYGVGYLAAGLILAIMIVPFIISISREVISVFPVDQREAAYALGATRWETIWGVVLPGTRSGIIGGILLAMGRALGETMAVTMVIGNRPSVSLSLFAPGYTLASAIANEFTEATSRLYISALLELGLVLFGVSVVANAIARALVWRVTLNSMRTPA